MTATDFGDVDLEAIFPILVAGCIMLTPLLDWSTEICKHGRTVAICWGTLMFAVLVPTFVKTLDGVLPFLNQNQYITYNVDAAKNCTGEIFETFTTAVKSLDYYDK